MRSSGPTAVFVYGTLMPGHLRWWMLEPHALAHRPATAAGLLYDTGHGWPAAVLGPPGVVPGVAVDLDPGACPALLAELDVMEGVPDGRYERVVVTPSDGREAWAWSHLGPVDGLAAIAAWEGRPER